MSIHASFRIPCRLAAGFLLIACLAAIARAQRPVEVAPNAPRDKPMDAARDCQWQALQRAIAPYVAQARSSYPDARRRFLAGLPAKESFFITTVISDARGRHEQVFIAVDSIAGDRIHGRIWSDINLVQGYHLGQPYSARDSEILDWMFSKPDGSEEGNLVGKFLDGYQAPPTCVDSTSRSR